jgi:hypothetical protein
MCIASLIDAQREFTAHLPAVENATRFAFRRRRLKRHDYEDILAEAIAACWNAWVGLLARGRNPLEVGVCGIANYAVRYVRNGRRIANRSGGRGPWMSTIAGPRRPADSESSMPTAARTWSTRQTSRSGATAAHQPMRRASASITLTGSRPRRRDDGGRLSCWPRGTERSKSPGTWA